MRKRNTSNVTDATVLLDRNQAQEIFNLGWQSIDRIATECGAKIRINKRVLYSRRKLEERFDSLIERN